MTTSHRIIRQLRGLLAVASTAIVGASCDDALSPEDEYVQAVAATERWVAANPTSWTLASVGLRAPRRTEWSASCAINPPSGFVALNVQTASTRLTVFFRCPLSSPATVQQLQDAFNHIVLEELPHGLSVPNWHFSLLTPVSSFSSGVTFGDATSGRVRLQIETMLSSIYGHSTRQSCIPPQDDSSAPTCYVHRTHQIPLSLNVTVPFDRAEFN